MVNGTKKIYGAVIAVGAIFGFSIGLLSGSISRSKKLDAEQKSLDQVQSSMMENLYGDAVTNLSSKAAKTKSAKAEMSPPKSGVPPPVPPPKSGPTTAESDWPPPVLPPPLPMDRYQADNGGDASCPSSVDMQALQQARQVTLDKYSALKEAESFEVYSAEMRTLWDVEDENIAIIVPQAGTYTGIEEVIEYITLVVGSINGGFASYYDAALSNFEYFGTNSSYAFQVAQKAQFDCTVLPSASDPGVCQTGEMDSLSLHHVTWKPCSALISQYVIAYDDQQNYFATKGLSLPSICNRHQRFCTGENQQYDNYIDCMSFMERIPSVSCANSIFNGDNAICRFKHSLMVQFSPDFHCPHLGKVTYACTDEDCGGDLTCDGKSGDLTYTPILPNACSKDCGADSSRNFKTKSSKSTIGKVNTSRCASSWN